MLLRSRYIVFVNVVILVAMAAFFLVNDRRLRRSHIDATVEATSVGVRARGIADTVAKEIVTIVHLDEYVDTVRAELQAMASDQALGADVLDIRLTISLDPPVVIASLSGEPEDLMQWTGRRTLLELDAAETAEINTIVAALGIIDSYRVGVGSGMVIGLGPYRDTWATRILIPYAWDIGAAQDGDPGINQITEVGLIEILLDSEKVPAYWRDFRNAHLLIIGLMAVALTLFIDMTTDRMVLRPLQRLTDIIRRAERGVVDTSETFPRNEVGAVSATLTDMLATMQRLHGERVQALERLAGGVAHEIRNPLHAISMSAQYLKELTDKAPLSPDQKEDADEVLDMVLSEVRELDRITDQFMNLTRPTKMEWESADLNDLVRKVLADCSMVLYEAAVTVRAEYGEGLPQMTLDVVRLRSAIYNLVQNAAQAMPGGGSLEVVTAAEPGGATIEIRDTGPGIPPDALERIFDPYYTTRESEGGMGLGLTLTRNAVLAHGGDIDARSRAGAGSVFRVRLPYRHDIGKPADRA
jgi:signal transduction histidine kinase